MGIAASDFQRRTFTITLTERDAQKIINGDAVAAINYLQGKTAASMTVARYTCIGDDSLGNLFWAD